MTHFTPFARTVSRDCAARNLEWVRWHSGRVDAYILRADGTEDQFQNVRPSEESELRSLALSCR